MSRSHLAGPLSIAALWCASALAQPPTPPQPPDQPPAGGEPHQRAEEAMQGGGMTQEMQLDDMQARAHFRVGQSLYDAGRFDEAAHEFEEAYRLSQRAELLFNAYVAFRDASDLDGAVRSLSTYLENAHDVPDRLNLQARLNSLRAALQEREAQAQAQPPPPPPPEPINHPGEVWPWIVASVGAAAAIASIFTGVVAMGDADHLARDCPFTAQNSAFVCPPGYDLATARGSAQAMAITTDALLFGGGAIAVTGLVLGLIVGLDRTEMPVTATAACGPDGCRAIAWGRF